MDKKQKLLNYLTTKQPTKIDFSEFFSKHVSFMFKDNGTTEFVDTRDVLTDEEVELIKQFTIQATIQLLQGGVQAPTMQEVVAKKMQHVDLTKLLGD